MAAKHTFHLPSNGEVREYKVPARNLAGEVKFTDWPPLADVPGAVIAALEDPIGVPPLRESVGSGKTVAVLFGDRFTNHIVGVRDGVGIALLNHLNGLGVRDGDVTFVFAPGSHAHPPDLRERLGPELLSRARFHAHDAFDESNLTYLGPTSRGTPVWVDSVVMDADTKIGIGEISPVGLAGWCGGGKIILPGVAGIDTIEHNHRMVISKQCVLGVLDGNPTREDIEEAAGLARLDMKADVLVDTATRVVKVYAGHYRQEHRAAMADARAVWTTKLQPAKVAVNYPSELREKNLANALYMTLQEADLATESDGALILISSADGDWPKELDDVYKVSCQELARKMVRKEGNGRTMAIAYQIKEVLERKPVILVSSSFDPAEGREIGFARVTASFDDALGEAFERAGRDAGVVLNLPRAHQWRMMPWPWAD